MENNNGLPLLKLTTAYQSLRESGFDFSTAIGELIDNSVQADAKRIDIKPKIELKNFDSKSEPVPVITQISVFDDGDGMDEETLNGCPQLGYSTRFNDREGLGRFGVGATYASISQCKRTTFCSRRKGAIDYSATYIDLDEIASKSQISIPKPSILYLPKNLEDLCLDSSNTIVVWDKCDRLLSDANGKPIVADEFLNELEEWVSRAYRHKIWNRVEIYINGEKVVPHDPLYLNSKQTKFPDEDNAIERFSTTLDWPVPNSPEETSTISIKLTLLPEAWRMKRGDGGSSKAQKLKIDKNQGISVLRHYREVAYGNFHPMVPKQIDIDRWWGCEINFQPELDECWEIRNVKRGARPTKELRDKLNEIITPEIQKLRKDVQIFWNTSVPTKIFQYVSCIASTLMDKNENVSVPEVQNSLQEIELSVENIKNILKELAVENKWDWTTDGTHRKYEQTQLPFSESDRKKFFYDIKSAIENSNIDQKFKNVALYDLEQAQVSYEEGAFKACIIMFGAILEGLMLGVIRQETTLKAMIANPTAAPKDVQKIKNYRLTSSSTPQDLAENISEHLGFEAYKNITVHLKPEIERLQIHGIQNFRNSVHPWKCIKEPNIYDDPSQARAMQYLSSLSILAERILS